MSRAELSSKDSNLFDSPDSECEEPHYQLSENDNYFTNDNLFKGKQGEKIPVSALKINYKTKDGYIIEHNNFGSEYEYCCGSGVDIKAKDARN